MRKHWRLYAKTWTLGIADEVTVVRGSAANCSRNYTCDIAFFDPPYEQDRRVQPRSSTARQPFVIL